MNQGRPQPPPPWISEYDYQSQRWFFVNQQTGERSWNFPQSGGYGPEGYGPPQGYNGGQQNYQQGGYENQERPPQPKPSHAGRNTALAAVGGLAAGALLMHEGHKVEEHWDEDKARFEDRVDYDRDRIEDRVDYDRERFDDRVRYDEDRVEDFPEDAANWTGRKVQEVEDIPENVAGWAGRKTQEVEDIPEDVAGWAGRKVGEVEDFGDDVRDSYDDGRDEQQYNDDERNDDGW